MKAFVVALIAAFTLSVTGAGAQAMTKKKSHHKHHRHSKGHHKPAYYGHDENVQFKKGDEGRPSAYHGDNVPENDGVKKNEERNKNYQTGQPLPPSNGNNGR